MQRPPGRHHLFCRYLSDEDADEGKRVGADSFPSRDSSSAPTLIDYDDKLRRSLHVSLAFMCYMLLLGFSLLLSVA